MERSAYQTDRPRTEPQLPALDSAAEVRMLEALLGARRAAQLPAFHVEDRRLLDSLRHAADIEEIEDRRAALVLKLLAGLHQGYRANGLHEQAEGVAVAATMLVRSRRHATPRTVAVEAKHDRP